MEPGQQITLRGPYGNGFPVESDFLGRDLLFIAGGIGLAPLRSVIHYVRDRRDRYGQVDIVYGARSREDLVDYPEIVREWSKEAGLRVHLTIDREQAGWEGHVGFVPDLSGSWALIPGRRPSSAAPHYDQIYLGGAAGAGFSKDAGVYHHGAADEMRHWKCGRCNIGDQYVCKDGPVFRCDQLDQLPDEY